MAQKGKKSMLFHMNQTVYDILSFISDINGVMKYLLWFLGTTEDAFNQETAADCGFLVENQHSNRKCLPTNTCLCTFTALFVAALSIGILASIVAVEMKNNQGKDYH